KGRVLSGAFKIAFVFGFVQFLTTFAGFLLGISVKVFVESVDHIIAFVLLSIVGGKMIFEAFKKGEDEVLEGDLWWTLLVLGVATSIDAFIVGITLPFFYESVVWPLAMIGVVTFLVAFFGFIFGKKLRVIFGRKVEVFGGLVLIGIGVKVLIEHLL
ncbi:MAG: manganese efflux pump MntP family protein, partial [Candidatus Gracilibacteria bacterium]